MSLTPKDERLLALALAITRRDPEALRAIRRAAPPGEPDRAWRETVLQTHLFAGFPSVVEALRVLGRAGGLGAPDPDELDVPDDAAAGPALFGAIYGDHAPSVRAQIADAHPLFERWVVDHAYGRVLARPGLPARTRELLATACLAAQGLDRQLASHVRGALAVGATRAELRATLTFLETHLRAEEHARAAAVFERFAG